jgi:hypothetical protein
MEFQIPKIVHEEIDENRGIFEIEPLDEHDVTDRKRPQHAPLIARVGRVGTRNARANAG